MISFLEKNPLTLSVIGLIIMLGVVSFNNGVKLRDNSSCDTPNTLNLQIKSL